ncbi:diguanylate cyclase [Plasticicumulans lactativorans]|uniref:diguanylate cyclase n=1 Tax=Plasticicumulans lactativorans TaxID=1133106 RepID=A0A4R2L616_9GAMM|nr:GGDEF domain-containing protein [Plasticicumulans lactativorans]TCO82234.1 diguanylate cyclase [Plasticicumulans lactativorans]
MNAANDATEWKRKYFEVLRELERKERDWSLGQELLTLAVRRLSLLAQGLDTRLDPHLESLRAGLRGELDPPRLRADLGRITQLLDELRDLGKNGLDDELVRLLGLLRLSTSRQAAVDNLVVRLRQTPPPREALIEAIAVELNQVLLPPTAAAPPPAAAIPAAAAADPARSAELLFGSTLAELLDGIRLAWTPPLEQAREALRQRLAAGIEQSGWHTALDACVELVNRAVAELGGERDELRRFLEQVTERLLALEALLREQAAGVVEARGGRAALEGAVGAEMRGMREGVERARDLDSLKRNMLARVEQIDRHLQAFRSAEEGRLARIDERVRSLSAQLSSMHEETRALRGLLAEQDERLQRDPLTGLNNRFAYDERLQREFVHWQAHGQPLALLVWDIDHFKRINDTLGHAIGDQVLVGVGRGLASGLRGGDFVARYGGEEFVMLLPGVDLDSARGIAERIRAEVATTHFPVTGSDVAVTVSCGLTLLREGDTPRGCFERADQGLLAAKRGGRNRCVAV